jgi:hypothetical protein
VDAVDINYGVNGASVNMYNERYNSYLQDGLHIASGGRLGMLRMQMVEDLVRTYTNMVIHF